jgi:hypothetical protein
MKVFGQGYLFEKGAYATGIKNVLFSGLSYITFEAWLRPNEMFTGTGRPTLNLYTVYNTITSLATF